MVLDMKPLFAEQAKARQMAGYNQYSPVPPEGTSQKGKTRDQLAKIAKVSKSSGSTSERGEKVCLMNCAGDWYPLLEGLKMLMS